MDGVIVEQTGWGWILRRGGRSVHISRSTTPEHWMVWVSAPWEPTEHSVAGELSAFQRAYEILGV